MRALLLPAAPDRRAGLSTKGLVSGDRRSPVSTIDGSLAEASVLLNAASVRRPLGIHENLALTQIWGPAAGLSVNGVFDLWCGKVLGLDRSMDALRNATGDGIAPAGGPVSVVGDAPSEVSATIHSRCAGHLARGAEVHLGRLLMPRAFYEVARLWAWDPLLAPDRTLCGRALHPCRVDLSEGLAGLVFRAIEATEPTSCA